MSINNVVLVGRLTRDPELRYTANGTATCSFTLAVDDPFAKGEKKADFINIVTWQKTAETCANYLKKGRLTGVTGRMKTRDYENNEGRKIFVTEVVADNVRFLESSSSKPSESQQEQRQESSTDPFQHDGKPIDISDDDLPF